MLHTETVTPETLALIKELQKHSFLQNFYLVGGTSLALQIGHRTSTDIDLFSNEEFSISDVRDEIKILYNPDSLIENRFGVFSFLKGIKTDIVYHPYKLIDSPIETDGIRMLSKKEIVAMKLNAITRRGRKRDFIDLYKLLEHFSLPEMLEFYTDKYEVDSSYYLMRSIVYFDDADNDEDPKCFFKYNWKKIKQRIINEVKQL